MALGIGLYWARVLVGTTSCASMAMEYKMYTIIHCYVLNKHDLYEKSNVGRKEVVNTFNHAANTLMDKNPLTWHLILRMYGIITLNKIGSYEKSNV